MSDRAPAARKAAHGARAPSAAAGKGAGAAVKQPPQPTFNVGVWSADEHQRYLRAKLQNPKAAWKDIARCVGTRTPRQVVLHDQKYRAKMARLWSKCQTVAEQTKQQPVASEGSDDKETQEEPSEEETLEPQQEAVKEEEDDHKEEAQEKPEQPVPEPQSEPHEFRHPQASSPPRPRPPFTLPVSQPRPLQPATSHPQLFTLPPLPSSLPRPLVLPPLSHTQRSLAPTPAFPHAFSSTSTAPSTTSSRVPDADSMGVLLLATVASAQMPTGAADDRYYYSRSSSHR